MSKKITFVDFMEDRFGDNYDKVVITKPEKVEAIPTGSLSLDVSIGIGGIPRGRFSVIDGVESSGKTTLASSIMRNSLKATGKKGLYIDTENQADYSYMELLLGKGNIEEQNIFLVQPKTSDDAFMVAEKAISLDDFGCIIIDSVAALSPEEEIKKGFEDSNMAIIPRDLAKFFRRNVFDVRTKQIAVVFLNQVRDNIGAYVKSYTTPGGHALRHYASVIITLSKESDITLAETKIGIMSKFTVKKNKVGPPFRSFSFPIIFGSGIDTMRDLVVFAERLGVLTKGGAYYKFQGETLGRGMVDTLGYLNGNKEVLDSITSMCYNIVSKYENEQVVEEDEI